MPSRWSRSSSARRPAVTAIPRTSPTPSRWGGSRSPLDSPSWPSIPWSSSRAGAGGCAGRRARVSSPALRRRPRPRSSIRRGGGAPAGARGARPALGQRRLDRRVRAAARPCPAARAAAGLSLRSHPALDPRGPRRRRAGGARRAGGGSAANGAAEHAWTPGAAVEAFAPAAGSAANGAAEQPGRPGRRWRRSRRRRGAPRTAWQGRLGCRPRRRRSHWRRAAPQARPRATVPCGRCRPPGRSSASSRTGRSRRCRLQSARSRRSAATRWPTLTTTRPPGSAGLPR